MRELTCRQCGLRFYVCRRCWRGQAYCCDPCRKAVRSHAHREAQRRYRATLKGREAHRLGERRRRMQRAKKTVADQSSIPTPSDPILIQQRTGCCRFCGREGIVVEQFPRRGYARGGVRDLMGVGKGGQMRGPSEMKGDSMGVGCTGFGGTMDVWDVHGGGRGQR